MGFFSLFIIAVGLSMDAFAVSICKGLSWQKVSLKNLLTVGLWFGGFQALMPLAGYFLGSQFERFITSIDHWIAFVLLILIGASMVRESLSKEEESPNPSLAPKIMAALALATSIDALAVGVTFAFLQVAILPAVLLIGVTTFLFSCAGVKIGNTFGARYKSRAELLGGIILICMGIKILLEHLSVL